MSGEVAWQDPLFFLDGVDVSRRTIAEEELRSFIRETFQARFHGLLAVAITSQFASLVDDLGRQFGAIQPGSPQYDQARSHVKAVAKILPCYVESRIGFVLIVDATAFDSKAFNEWSAEAGGIRRYYVGHELIHIGDMVAEVVALGAAAFMDHVRRWQNRPLTNATTYWQEYHAIRVIREAAAPWSYEHELRLGYGTTLRDLLSDLSAVLRERIARLRLGYLTIDQYLKEVLPRLNQIFTLWVYLLAMEDAGGQVDDSARQHPVYEKVLGPAAAEVKPILQRLYENQWRYQPEILKDLGDAIDRACEKFSVKYEPRPDGSVYVRVLEVNL